MDREIKFRGRRNSHFHNGEWVYGLVGYNSGGGYGRICDWMGEDGAETYQEVEVDPKTITMFTGLQDKNGKDIYEGDIVISFKKPYEDSPTTNVVEFAKGCWRLVCKGVNDIPLFNYSPKELQVIGNQFESPELINNK